MQAEKQKGAWIKIVYWSLVFTFMAMRQLVPKKGGLYREDFLQIK